MPIKKETLGKYINNYFVETGTGRGKTIDKAISLGFKKIISIEKDKKKFGKCYRRFKSNKDIVIYHGSSIELLADIIKDIDDKITFWLDAHTGDGYKNQKGPLISELEIIKNNTKVTPTILIDDRKLLPTYNITEEEVINKLLEIYPDFSIKYEEGAEDREQDIIVAIKE